jgi:hypothetical protein
LDQEITGVTLVNPVILVTQGQEIMEVNQIMEVILVMEVTLVILRDPLVTEVIVVT